MDSKHIPSNEYFWLWSQMFFALIFMSTGVIYLNRKEEEFEEVAA